MYSIFNNLPKKKKSKVMYSFKITEEVLEDFKKRCQKYKVSFGSALEALIVQELEKNIKKK